MANDTLMDKIQKEYIREETLLHTNVVIKIEDNLEFLRGLLKYGETYALTITSPNATTTVTRDGQSVSAGASALNYGDIITITAVASAGYEITSLKVNGADFVSGNKLTVTGAIAIVVETQATA